MDYKDYKHVTYIKADSLMKYLDELESDCANSDQRAVVDEIRRWVRTKFYRENNATSTKK